jgi:hypothetical protein
MSRPRHAWREPMVWLMLAIPAATVVAGIATLRLARAEGGLDAAPESVQRTAQTQVTDLGPDRRAAALGLQANLRVDARGRPVLRLPERADGALALRLVHPTRADGDLEWTRAVPGGDWSGPAVPIAARGHWVLEPADRAWRLVGRWPVDGGVVALQPAVAAR